MFRLDSKEKGLDILYGGWFLGGGGGGYLKGGETILDAVLALGGIGFLTIDELPERGQILTASLVGSPAVGGASIGPKHFKRTYELYKEYTGEEIAAFISNEAGGQSITNGWMASAVSGIPMLDAACDGRAHPTGVMGSMGLEKNPSYTTIQVAVGGTEEEFKEYAFRGTIDETSAEIRKASTEAGGFISVLRNPVSSDYIKANAAHGVVTMCMEVGALIRKNIGSPEKIIASLSKRINLEKLSHTFIDSVTLISEGGFDKGEIILQSGEKIQFFNEYMSIEKEGKKLFAFPDLIVFLSAETGLPINSADITVGKEVYLVAVPKDNLLLPPCILEYA